MLILAFWSLVLAAGCAADRWMARSKRLERYIGSLPLGGLHGHDSVQ